MLFIPSMVRSIDVQLRVLYNLRSASEISIDIRTEPRGPVAETYCTFMKHDLLPPRHLTIFRALPFNITSPHTSTSQANSI